MQNKANLPNAQMNVSSVKIKDYDNEIVFRPRKNKPKQTQLVAAQPLAKPDQTQLQKGYFTARPGRLGAVALIPIPLETQRKKSLTGSDVLGLLV